MLTFCCIKMEMTPAGGTVMRIEGSATFEHEPVLHRAIDKAFMSSGCLEIRCGTILAADYSFVMLICAAHRTAEILGKRLIVREILPKGALKHLEHARDTRKRGCLYTSRQRCTFRRSLFGADGGDDCCAAGEERSLIDGQSAEAKRSGKAAGRRGGSAPPAGPASSACLVGWVSNHG